MARAMQDREVGAGDRHRVPLLQPAVRRDVARAHQPHRSPCAARPSSRNLSAGCGPSMGIAAELLLQLGGAAGMIDVAVGEQDLLDRHADLGDRRLDAVEVAARVDHRALLGLLVPEQRAVLLERRDGHDGGFQRH